MAETIRTTASVPRRRHDDKSSSDVFSIESESYPRLESARHALAEASTVDEIKSIRDKAEAARNYAKAAKLGVDIQNAAATVKLEAERKAGSVLAEALCES